MSPPLGSELGKLPAQRRVLHAALIRLCAINSRGIADNLKQLLADARRVQAGMAQKNLKPSQAYAEGYQQMMMMAICRPISKQLNGS